MVMARRLAAMSFTQTSLASVDIQGLSPNSLSQ
jgi:hypothetical protein